MLYGAAPGGGLEMCVMELAAVLGVRSWLFYLRGQPSLVYYVLYSPQ